MPSAAKLEKQASTEAVDPIRQAIVIIDHKIRNLEKRKRKIESYRELQKTGKELNSDQLQSVAKYEEVLQTLDFARDLSKQFNGIAADAVKQHKKQARKEAQERAQQELVKVKEILMIQDVLQNMGQDNVREDFLAGRNGAAQLTEEDLKYLDDLYGEVCPKHSTEEGVTPFQEQLQQCAEHLLAIVDAKPKDIVGTTYAKLKELVGKIQACSYFDQTVDETSQEPTNEVADPVQVAPEEVVEEEEYVLAGEAVVVPVEAPVYPPAVAPVVAPAPVPTIVQQAPVVAPVPTPVAAVESSFFSTSAPAFVPAQAAIPARPLNEVIGSVSGSFNFLQESELDSPDLSVMLTGAAAAQPPQQHTGPTPPPAVSVAVAPIPSQTFTNQNFAAVSTTPVQPKVVYQPTAADISQSHIPGFVTTPNPPPPIPMPPSHQPPQQQQQHRSMSPAVSYGGQAVAQGPSYASQAQQQQQPATTHQYAATQQQPVDPTVYSAHHPQEIVESVELQQVPEPAPMTADEPTDDWGSTDVSNTGDWSQQTDANQGDWSQQTDDWGGSSTTQNDNYITQTSNRGYGRARGGRGGNPRGGAPNGYVGGRGRGGNYQNGRGSGGGGYGYRNSNDGNNSYYQNGYQQRDNFGGSSGGNNNYKRGSRGGGSGGNSRGGMERGSPRGNRNNPRGGNRGGGSNYVRGGGNKQ